jgi:hypothetical protein
VATSSDVIVVLSALNAAQVFLIGFASVRSHSHLDRTLSRYDDLVDRSVSLSLQTAAFPTPHQIKSIEETIFSGSRDWSGIAVVIVSSAVAALGVGVTVASKLQGVLQGAEYALAAALSVLTVVFLGVLAVDNVTVGTEFRRSRNGAIHRQYELGSGRLEVRPRPREPAKELVKRAWVAIRKRGPADANAERESRLAHAKDLQRRKTLLEDVNLQLPRWPWAMLELASLLRASNDVRDKKVASDLAEEVTEMVKEAHKGNLNIEKMDLTDLAVYWWSTLLHNPGLLPADKVEERLTGIDEHQYPDCVHVYARASDLAHPERIAHATA